MIKPLELHIWRLDLPVGANITDTLDSNERGRASRLLRPADRDRYVSAHVQLRMILGRYLNRSPQQIVFDRGAHGKPRLRNTGGLPDIRFNLSHSSSHGLVALTLGAETGIDLEETNRDVDASEIAHRYFAPEEALLLDSLAPEERKDAFYCLWTKKEAIVKAMGEGVFSFEAASVEQLLQRGSGHPEAAGAPCLFVLRPVPTLVAAVATLGPIDKVKILSFEHPC